MAAVDTMIDKLYHLTPDQPHEQAAVEMWYSNNEKPRWIVRYVAGMASTGRQRRWELSEGRSLWEALYNACQKEGLTDKAEH